ncbi:MAG TPA: PQQ-binding-like beta-propeller repeat protein, partial [Vicinamibacterales bacterium]|nr:PQQ-binding-like beta-propeller repeat protein [Vicinamibacterales bacterium]
VHADNWPHWRGPSASGVSPETGLPSVWSEAAGVAWKSPIRGLGVSSPIVWGERVIVTSQVGSGAARQGPRLGQGADAGTGERSLGGAVAAASRDGVTFLVTAFDRKTGQMLWESSIKAEGTLPPVHDKHNLASPSPVTDGERIYAWFGSGQIVALDMNGKMVWTRNPGADYGAFDINWGHASSPTVHNGALFLICYHDRASYLLSIDARTGAVRWKADQPAGVTSYSTPLVVTNSRGAAEVIVNSSVGITAHHAATGAVLWKFDEPNRFPVPMPAAHDGIIYTTRGYRSSPFMAIRPGGTGDIANTHVVWRVASGGPYISSLVYYEGLIYMAGDVGVLTVIDAKDGERVHQSRIGGVYSASPVAADGKIYLLSEDGETIVLSAGRTPTILSRNKLDARQLASPAISGGRLFIRSDDALYAIGK